MKVITGYYTILYYTIFTSWHPFCNKSHDYGSAMYFKNDWAEHLPIIIVSLYSLSVIQTLPLDIKFLEKIACHFHTSRIIIYQHDHNINENIGDYSINGFFPPSEHGHISCSSVLLSTLDYRHFYPVDAFIVYCLQNTSRCLSQKPLELFWSLNIG